MSELPQKRAKRGRPAKNPEKKQRPRSESQSSCGNIENEIKIERPKSGNKSVDLYYELHGLFIREGISQQSQHLLRKISSNPLVPESLKGQPLLVILNLMIQEFFMNELEIVVLSIYLEKFGWAERQQDLELMLRFLSYSVKHNLSEDIAAINAYVNLKYPRFMEDFQPWFENLKHLMSVNPKDLNDKFKELSKAAALPGDAKIMDYNSYVDEILQYNPHMLYDKPQVEEILNDPGCLEFITAVKNKRKILTKDNEEVSSNLLVKVEHVTANFASILKDENSAPLAISQAVLMKMEAFVAGDDEPEQDED